MPSRTPDAREVDRVEALATALGEGMTEAFLARCVPGSMWTARIRTAEVEARIVAREPLGSFEESACTCLTLSLARPVPVEPGLRFQIVADDKSGVVGACLVRPWAGTG